MNPVPLFSRILLASFLLSSRAHTAETRPLPAAATPSVESLVTEVLGQNLELQFYDAEITAARAALTTSAQLPQPEVSGSIGRKRTTELTGILAGEGTAWSAGVSQTFEWPGRLGLRKAIANRDLLLAGLGRARFTNALAGKARSLAYGVSASAERRRVAGEVADRFHALREVLVQRDPAGVAPALEIRILEAMELSLRHKAAKADQEWNTLRTELNLLRGLPADAPLDLHWVEPMLGPAPRLESVLAAAQTNNFDLRLRVVELEQQGFRVELARNERWPAFTIGTHYSEERSDARDQMIGLSVSFPLPLWRNTAARTEAAQARRVQAESVLATARRDLERRLTVAVSSYGAQTAELQRWRPDTVEQFRAAAELADRHYRLGAVPATTYVELQKQYTEAVDAWLDTRREAVDHAQEIEQLSGVPVLPAGAAVSATIQPTTPARP